MAKDKAVSMMEWLKKITPDQNLEKLEDIVKTVMNGHRRWFQSKVLQPILVQGTYDVDTGKYVLGIPSKKKRILFSTASVNSLSLTAEGDERIRIIYAGAVNITQVSTVSLTATLDGNALAVPLVTPVSNTSIVFHGVIGNRNASATTSDGSLDELWLEPGDSATLTCNVFAAGNDTEHIFIYESYRLG